MRREVGNLESMKRSERIKSNISIFSVLSSYNYDVVNTPREQQFRCNLHGDGSDNNPSARAYPDSNSWYCFACGKTRDAISTVMEIEGIGFSQACKVLEVKYNLPVWVPSKKEEVDHFKEVEVDEIQVLSSRVEKLLSSKTKEIDLDISLRLWEAFNMLSCIDSKKEQWIKLYKSIRDVN